MKFEKKKELLEYLNNLIGSMEISISLADSISSVFGVSTITNKEQIESMAKKFNTSEKDVYLDLLADYFGFDMSEVNDIDFFEKYIKSNFYELKEENYYNNPYYKNINIKDIKNKEISLFMDKYEPYEIFPVDDIEIDKEDFYQEITKFGYFKNIFPFMALNHKDTTWMAITPNEINTMKKHIEKAHGNIIVFGLGLGYFSYMASIKEEVKTITIIDNDQRIINLFIKHILPQFEFKDKIKVVNSDALEVIKSPLNYDFAFVDLWHSPEDGIDLFLNFKRKENLSKNCSFSYWLDVAMYAYLRRAFIQLIAEQLDSNNQSINYKNAKNSWDKLINNYYYKTKDLKIDNIEQVKELLQDESLLKMAL